MTETELEEVERRISEAGANLTDRELGNMWKRCAIDRYRNNCELRAALEAKDAEIEKLRRLLTEARQYVWSAASDDEDAETLRLTADLLEAIDAANEQKGDA